MLTVVLTVHVHNVGMHVTRLLLYKNPAFSNASVSDEETLLNNPGNKRHTFSKRILYLTAVEATDK